MSSPDQILGFRIESRIPFLGEEWEPCKIAGQPPEAGFTLREALRTASSIHNLQSDQGPEFQIRVTDPSGNEVVQDSNRNKH